MRFKCGLIVLEVAFQQIFLIKISGESLELLIFGILENKIIIQDDILKILDSDQKIIETKKLLGLIGNLTDSEIRSLMKEVLSPIGYNLIVTPKEVDFEIDKLSEVISYGINHSLNNI